MRGGSIAKPTCNFSTKNVRRRYFLHHSEEYKLVSAGIAKRPSKQKKKTNYKPDADNGRQFSQPLKPYNISAAIGQ